MKNKKLPALMRYAAILLLVLTNMSNASDDSTVQATEEAIVNALVAAETMTGINGNSSHAIPHDRLQAALRKYNRLQQ